MQKDRKRIQEAKIQLVGISYDSVEILKKFSSNAKLDYPLLSDPESKTIKAYGILNEKAKGRQAGIPHPGTYVIVDGKVKAHLDGTVRRRHSTEELIQAVQK